MQTIPHLASSLPTLLLIPIINRKESLMETESVSSSRPCRFLILCHTGAGDMDAFTRYNKKLKRRFQQHFRDDHETLFILHTHVTCVPYNILHLKCVVKFDVRDGQKQYLCVINCMRNTTYGKPFTQFLVLTWNDWNTVKTACKINISIQTLTLYRSNIMICSS